jgi:hypothetical protein
MVVIGATGCGEMRPVTLPNGHQGYALRCSGTHNDFGDCKNEALELCHGPYQFVDENGKRVGDIVAPVGQSAVLSGTQRTLFAECVPQ